MSENCNKFEWTIESLAKDEKYLPLRQTDNIPPIHIKPKPGLNITRLSVSTSEPFQSNQTPETAAAAAASGANITFRAASLRRSCILNISYSTATQHSDEKCIIEIPTRVPIHVPGPNAHWRASDIKLERTVKLASSETRYTISDLAANIKKTKETIVWLEGDSGSGKSTFIESLCKTVRDVDITMEEAKDGKQEQWCVVVLDGGLLHVPKEGQTPNLGALRNKVIGEFLKELNRCSSSDSVAGVAVPEIGNHNWKSALANAVSRHQGKRLLLIFEEFDAFFQGIGGDAREILMCVKDDIIRPFSGSAKGGILIVVDQVAPSIRDIAESADQLKPFQHWTLHDYFTVQEVKDILGQLTPHTSFDAVANRIWMWTRGQPTLVNSLVLQYIEQTIESLSGSHEHASQTADAIIDMLAYSDRTREHVDYLVDKKCRSDDVSFERLSDGEKEIIKSLGTGSVKNVEGNKQLESLIAKGIVKETRSPTGAVSYHIPIPLIRLHLGRKPVQAG